MSYENRRDDLIRKLFARKQASIASLAVKYNMSEDMVTQIVTDACHIKKNENIVMPRRDIATVRNRYSAILPRPLIILKTVADHYDNTVKDLRSKRRTYAFARQVAMVMLYEFTPLSKKGVGAMLRRDRTTALHALRKIDVMASGGKIPEINELRRQIAANLNREQHEEMAA